MYRVNQGQSLAEQLTELSSVNVKTKASKSNLNRVKSAHPRINRLSELAREMVNSSSEAMVADLGAN